MSSTTEEQIACAKRELGFRERVYPRFIEQKKLSQEKADREIEIMRDILARLEAAAARAKVSA